MYMKRMKFVDALRDGIREEMLRDENVFLLGEAIGKKQGGAFFVTKGLEDEFGISEVDEETVLQMYTVGDVVRYLSKFCD